MRIITIMAMLLVIAVSSSCSDTYNVIKYKSVKEQKELLYSISRYIAKLPPKATHDTKFDRKYDKFYQQEMDTYKVEQYFIAADSTHYFLISRPAPSLHQKKVGIGGKIHYRADGKIDVYEEVFRTWKLPEAQLEKKGKLLFATMVENKSLAKYLPQNTDEEWIEFPDASNYYDTTSRRWKITDQQAEAIKNLK